MVLESDRDGIEQVSEILAERSDLAAVHVITHGADGQINLGNSWLNSTTLQQNSDAVAGWGNALTETGDILFYGCNIAADSAGQSLLDDIAELTGADVAASDDATGHQSLGGDWELEKAAGIVETAMALSETFRSQWVALLPTYEEFTNYTDDREIKSDANCGQTFQHNSGNGTYTVNQLSLALRKDADATAQNITVTLRDSWNGTVLGSATIASSSLGTGYAWFDLDIGSVTLTDNTSYTIRVTSSTANGMVYAGFNLSGGYAGGTMIDVNGSLLSGEDIAFKVGYTPVNDAPIITSNGGGATAAVNVTENTTTVTTVTAADADLDTVTFSISGGADAAKFSINNTTGELSFINPPDFENPTDSNLDNIYDVNVQVSDGNGGTDSQDINITVTNAVEFIVTSTADSGAGSLRQAIIDANASANSGGPDQITFNIGADGSRQTINLLSPLDPINEAVIIDGFSQYGALVPTVPLVELNGGGTINDGLSFASTSDGSVVQGLMITGFSRYGIQVDADADGVTILGNWIGTTGTGYTGAGNDTGINIQGANTIIGGTGANDGNVITNNANEGINITGSGATGTIIQGNIIGLDPDGSTGSGNADVGIALLSGADNTTIGGTTVEARNVISKNFEGIEINSNNNVVQGNYIGTDITGTLDRGNRSDDGVEIQNSATGNLIGGETVGAGNVIAFNALNGVNVVSGVNNAIVRNSIHSNGLLGINLGAAGATANDNGDGDGGANNLQNFPVLTSAVTTGTQITITGTLNSIASTSFRIEFYANAAGDGTGYGEGQTLIGIHDVGTDGSGNATFSPTFSATVSAGSAISATVSRLDAGDAEVETSEFAQNVTATAAANTAPVNTVPGAQVVLEDTPLAISGISVNDVDGNLSSVQLSVTNGTLNLTLSGTSTISAGANGTNNLTLSGSQADINATLASLIYQGNLNYVGADTLTVISTDSNSAADTDTVAIAVNQDNDAPVVTTSGGATAYTEQASATVIDGALTLVDPDGFDGATSSDQFTAVVRITGNYEMADILSFTNTAKIQGNSVGDTLNLSVIEGQTATVADFQAALRSVTFYNGSDTPSELNRTITFSFDDGVESSNLATKTVTLTAINDDPTNTGSLPADVTVTEDVISFVDLSAANFSDVDAGSNLITVTLRTGTGGKIWASSDFDVSVLGSGTGTLTLTGGVADLNNFFSSATRFQYLHGTPHTAGDNADTIQVEINDGGNTGTGGGTTIILGTVNVDITAVNDAAPVATDDAYTVNEDNTLTIDWWDTDWTRRQQLTLDNLAQTETLTDFPVLVILNSSNIDYAQTKDDGSDLRFFAADGTPLAYEIEQWNEGGDSSVWVRVPQITSSSNSDSIWMYYGNSGAESAEDTAGVWDGNFVGVWHLNEEQGGTGSAGVYQDSTSHGNTGIDRVAATGQDGQVTDGQEFGSNDWIEIAHDASLDLTDSMTISFWIKPTSDSGTFNRVVEKGLWGYNDSYYFGGGNGTNDLTFYLNGQEVFDTPDDVLTVGEWQHAAVSYTSNGDGTGTARLYLNGVEIASGNYTNGAVPGNSGRLAIGHSDPLYDFDGFIDEVQISDTDRSADWIAAQYLATKNQFGAEFVQFGGEESAPTVGGVLSNDTDVDGDPLTATLVSGPTQAASFVLNKDGTFTYTPTADYAGSDSFTYEVSDGHGGTAQATATITVNPVNDAPILLTGSVNNLTVNEDSGLTSLGLGSVTYGLGGGSDESTQNLTYDVTVIPDSNFFGKIYLADGTTQVTTGSYTLAEIQGMQFAPNANESGISFFSFNVQDDGGTASGGSDILGQSIQITVNPINDAPSVTTTGTSLAYVEGDGATAIDPGLTLSDVDSANLTSATVSIISGFTSSEDTLNFTDQLGITGSYDAGTGVLTLNGTASVADYQTALRSVTYANSSEMPSTTNRVISFQVSDGATSGSSNRNITVASINDDPTNTGSLPTDITVTEDVISFVNLSAVNFADVDAGNSLITVTLTTSTGGKIWASSDFDITVLGSGTGTLTLTGGVADLNNFFNSDSRFQYLHDTTHTAGDNADTIQVEINDLGNTGTGGSGAITPGHGEC